MKLILFAAALLAVASSKELPTFEAFVELHARSYQRESAEFELRKALYQQRLEDAETHNSSPEKKWVAGVNKLWDWTEAELQTLRGWDGAMMPNGHHSSRSVARHGLFLQQTTDLPKEKVWDSLETFAYTKNQASCGSCWAIASSTVLEAHNEIYNGKHQIFSTQQIVDCTPNPRHCGGDGGCKGATAELAMDWVLKNGIAEAAQIPYKGKDGVCTRGSPSTDMKAALMQSAPGAGQGGAAIGMMSWSTLPKNEYEPLARALVDAGPAAVSVAADTWFSYEEGVFNGCGKDAVIDHAVVAMGYGEEGESKYWLIQNSWGDDWGEEGRIRLERHEKGDYCGMNNDPQKGVACQGETQPVPVCGMCGVLFDSVVPHFKSSQ
jgi:cathepsin L